MRNWDVDPIGYMQLVIIEIMLIITNYVTIGYGFMNGGLPAGEPCEYLHRAGSFTILLPWYACKTY